MSGMWGIGSLKNLASDMIAPKYEEEGDITPQSQHGPGGYHTSPDGSPWGRNSTHSGTEESDELVERLQGSLKESYDTIRSLQHELDASRQQSGGGASADEVNTLRARLQETSSTLDQYKVALDTAHSQYNTLRQQFEEQQQRLAAANGGATGTDDAFELIGQVQQLQDENGQLKRMLESAQQQQQQQQPAQGTDPSALAELQETMRLVQEENAQLKQHLQNAAAAPAPQPSDDGATAQALEKLQSDYTQLYQYSKQQEAAGAEMQAAATKLQQEYAQLQQFTQQQGAAGTQLQAAYEQTQRELADLKQAHEQQATGGADVQADVARLQSENTALQEQVDRLNKAGGELQAAFGQLQNEHAQARQSLEAGSSTSGQLQETVQSLQQECQQLKDTHQQQLAELQAALQQAQQAQTQQLNDDAQQREQSTALQNAFATLEKEHGELKAALERATSGEQAAIAKVHELEASLQQVQAEATQRVEASVAEQDALRKEIGELKGAAEAQANALREAQLSLGQLQDENAQHKKFIQEQASGEGDVKGLLQQLQDDNAQLKTQTLQLGEQLNGAVANAQAAQEQWNQERATLQQQAAQAAEGAESLRGALQQAEEAHAAMQKEISDLKAAAEADAQQHQAVVAQLQGEAATLRQEAEARGNGAEGVETLMKQLQDENAQLKEYGMNAQNYMTGMAEAQKHAEQRIDELTKKCTALENRPRTPPPEASPVSPTDDTLGKRVADLEREAAEWKRMAEQEAERSAYAEEQTQSLQRALTAAEKEKTALQQSSDTSAHNNELVSSLQQVIKELEDEVARVNSSREKERNTMRHMEQNIATLQSTNRDALEGTKNAHEVSNSIGRAISDMLKKNRIPVPSGSNSALSLVGVLTTEYQKLVGNLKEAEGTISQWEDTYNQARKVNASVSDQLKHAMKQISELREEISLKDVYVARLSQQTKSDSSMSQDMQMQLSAAQAENETLSERVSKLERDLHDTQSTVQEAVATATTAQAEAEELRQTLVMKDKEYEGVRQAAANLEAVLEQFQQEKAKEVEERTKSLSSEIDSLAHQVEALKKEIKDKSQQIDDAARAHKKEIVQKNASISSLQSRLGEIRKVLEDTMHKLNDDQMVDKRVVSTLMVNYVNSVLSKRGDEDDIIRVMSSLMGWDDTQQQRAGLRAGAQNPANHQGWRNSFASWVAPMPDKVAMREPLPQASLAELWVDFLLKEGENAGGGKRAELPAMTPQDSRRPSTSSTSEMRSSTGSRPPH